MTNRALASRVAMSSSPLASTGELKLLAMRCGMSHFFFWVTWVCLRWCFLDGFKQKHLKLKDPFFQVFQLASGFRKANLRERCQGLSLGMCRMKRVGS